LIVPETEGSLCLAIQRFDAVGNRSAVTTITPAIPGIRVPRDPSLPQDAEWIEVEVEGAWQRIRLHDYHRLYAIPGLYEGLFNRLLRCSSPLRVVSLLAEVMREQEASVQELRVLDLGAGSGLVGYELQNLNPDCVVGVDIIEEAREATLRDRPWCYDDYLVADFTRIPEEVEAHIRSYRLNAMTCVAALGFGDIPTKAFVQALDVIQVPGWLAFNIKEAFIQEQDVSGFDALVRQLAREGIIQIQCYRRYQHRLSCAGEPLYYIAMVARKERELPDTLLDA
jgi:SAM-dependent methyltransferase